MTTPRLDLTITYVRQFLRQYARPSVIDELIDVIDAADMTDDERRLLTMLQRVRHDLTGEDT